MIRFLYFTSLLAISISASNSASSQTKTSQFDDEIIVTGLYDKTLAAQSIAASV